MRGFLPLALGAGLVCGWMVAQPATQKVALVIGNDRYQFVTPLRTAVNDARAVQGLLHDRFGFDAALLVNATRGQIIAALNGYRRQLGANSELLIYYAGHGYYDKAVDKAYWWPVDAKSDDNSEWISADDITTNVKGLASRHVLIVSDSCFSGTLTRGVNVPGEAGLANSDRARTLQRLEQRSSRELLASGGNEPVSDGGAGQHSVFAGAFLNALQSMENRQFAAEELFQRVRESVAGRSAQIPQFDPIRNSGHDGGSFVFARLGGVIAPPVAPNRPSPGPAPVSPPVAPAPEKRRSSEFPQPPVPDPGGAVRLTRWRTALLVARDNPQAVTEEVVLGMGVAQISGETSMWTFIDEGLQNGQGRLNAKRPAFTYEWQKVIDQNPALAKGPLLDVFLHEEADWSFLKKEKEWDPQAQSIDEVFLYSREQVVGKDPQFAARRVAPVTRQLLMSAAAKAPAKMQFVINLPPADYDFNAKAVRFKKGNAMADFADVDGLTAMAFAAPTADSLRETVLILPETARATANYRPYGEGRSVFAEPDKTVKPGLGFESVAHQAIPSPGERWRDSFIWAGHDLPLEPLALALDRQLRLTAIPLDEDAAEKLHPWMGSLRAQVFLNVTGAQIVQWFDPNKKIPQGSILFAQVEKVKIIDWEGQVVATIDGKKLPLPESGRK